MTVRIIHQFETASRENKKLLVSRIINPDGIARVLKNIDGASEVERIGNNGDTTIIYHINQVTLKYFYSSGVGSFPNDRETITLYGKNEDQNKLKSKLRRKLEV